MAEERLQKIIARSGLCSRRDADRLVREGRVTVGGHVATPGTKADPETAHIKVDGKIIKAQQPRRYVLLYKPREVMTTCDDPEGRKTVVDLLGKAVRERVYPVGRLDYHSEGLIILTNDGDLAARVTHPRFGVVPEYMVKIRGDLTTGEYHRLMRGVTIDGQHVRPKQAKRERVNRDGSSAWWRIEVTEGRTHEVRELFFRAGHHVQRLRRVAIGPIRDSLLRPGDFRFLDETEVKKLWRATKRRKDSPSGSRRRPPRQGRKEPAKKPRRAKRS